MMRIHKYVVTPEFTLELAPMFEILTVQMQEGRPVMWVLEEYNYSKTGGQKHLFRTFATGEFVPFEGHYIGTFQPEPNLVFHLFEIPTCKKEE